MSERLLDLYRDILSTGFLVADAEGFISASIAGDVEPVTVDGKRLVLPTDKQLRSPGADRIVFHPLRENTVRGVESEVLAHLRKTINVKINVVANTLALDLLEIAASPAMHSKLSPDQQGFLSLLKNADKKTHAELKSISKAMPLGDPNRNFVSIFLKRGGEVAGRRYSKVGVVNFPLYQELQRAKKYDTLEVFGVKLERKMDRDTLIALLEYMFPRIEQPESYNEGSDSRLAPLTDALMKAVRLVAAPLNELLDLFANVMPDAAELRFNDSWVDAFGNLEELRRDVMAIPMQAGNEGHHEGEQPAAAPAAPVFAGSPQQQQPMAPAAVHVPAGYQLVPAPPAPPQIQKTANGLNFSSVLASNQALAWQVGAGYGGQPPMQQMQPVNKPPRWSQPGALGAPVQQQVYGGYMGAQPGYPQQGYPQQGYPQPGYPQQGPGYNTGGGFGRT